MGQTAGPAKDRSGNCAYKYPFFPHERSILEPFGKDAIMIKKLLIAFGITTMSLGATACNTVQGLGEDVQSVGEAGEDAID